MHDPSSTSSARSERFRWAVSLHEASSPPPPLFEGVQAQPSSYSMAAQRTNSSRNQPRCAVENNAVFMETPLFGRAIGGSKDSEPNMSAAGASRKKNWRPHCRNATCLRPASYAESGEHEPIFCEKHKVEGMQNVIHPNRGECNHVGCTRVSAYASTADTRGRFCHLHKMEGMVKIRDKIGTRCEELACAKQASFAVDGERYPRFCKDHKQDGMVNIRNLRCIVPRCPRGASFAAVGDRRGVYCGVHKIGGMINTRRKPRCVTPGCTSREPVYVRHGQQHPMYCVNHRGEGMTDMRSAIRTQFTIPERAVQSAKHAEDAPSLRGCDEREAALEPPTEPRSYTVSYRGQGTANAPFCTQAAGKEAITCQPRRDQEVAILSINHRPDQRIIESRGGFASSSPTPTLPPAFSPTPDGSTYFATKRRLSSQLGNDEEERPPRTMQVTAAYSGSFVDAGGRGMQMPPIAAGTERRPFRINHFDVTSNGGQSTPAHTDGAVGRSGIPKSVFPGRKVLSESCFAPRGLKRSHDKTTDVVTKGRLERPTISAFTTAGTKANLGIRCHTENVDFVHSIYSKPTDTARDTYQERSHEDGVHATRGTGSGTALASDSLEARASGMVTAIKKELGADSEALVLEGFLETPQGCQKESYRGRRVNPHVTSTTRGSLEKSHPPGYTRTEFYYLLVKALTGKK